MTSDPLDTATLEPASAMIARFAHAFDASQLEPRHFREVSRALLDTVAVAIAGHYEPAARLALAYGQTLGGPPEARLWAEPRLSAVGAETAALCNGVAAHVLDYDDVTSVLRGHASAALLPALLALGEARDASGRDLAAAFTVGFEVICRMARVMVSDHYARGWHATSSIGTIGAAVACARLLGLDAVGIVNTIGLAVAQTAGTRANFGTMAKSFQVGQCGAAAIRAARLAAHGFTASPDALDGPFGYVELYANGEDLFDGLEGLGGRGELELIRSGFEIKKYPLCYATHRVLDGLLDLRRENGLTLSAVERVDVLASAQAFAPLLHTRPQTGLEGKFSLQYAVAAALADGEVTLRSFTDEGVRRPAVQAFFPKVTGTEAAGGLLPRWVEITVTLRDGRCLMRRVDTLRGSANEPLSDAALAEKVNDCFAWGGGADAQCFIDAAAQLERLRVRQVLDAATRARYPREENRI